MKYYQNLDRITIRTDSPERLRHYKNILAKELDIRHVDGPKIGENGRLNYYIFVTENRPKRP